MNQNDEIPLCWINKYNMGQCGTKRPSGQIENDVAIKRTFW